jgi:exodeoxyribonuclease VII large subunit
MIDGNTTIFYKVNKEKDKIMILENKEVPILSVSEVSGSIKKIIEGTFNMVRIRGEVSSLKVHSSGHIYFTLKDESSIIDAICWRGTAGKLPINLQDGMEIICRGRITTYPARSKYQVILETAELAGVGALMKILQERKEKLEKEGLFSAHHKKPLPKFPTVIGVVTSPTGAVIQDILHRLRDRFPCTVMLWPVAVQGASASEEIARGIKGFNALSHKPDIMIVARGGGSLEDLWCFNEEVVVRAVFESKIPIISAVGHETDVTLIDFVADQRAPTPTAAAEMAVPVKDDLMLFLQNSSLQLHHSLRRLLKEYAVKIDALKRGLGNPQKVIDDKLLYFDEKVERFLMGMKNFMTQKENTLSQLNQLLESYSYQKTLKRGFTLVKDSSGALVTSSKQAERDEVMRLIFHDGDFSIQPCHKK